MNILVYSNELDKNNEKENKIKSKDVICPECGELCRIKIIDYKIKINECKNNHEYYLLLN